MVTPHPRPAFAAPEQDIFKSSWDSCARMLSNTGAISVKEVEGLPNLLLLLRGEFRLASLPLVAV